MDQDTDKKRNEVLGDGVEIIPASPSPSSTGTPAQGTTQTKPDSDTSERIKNLARVGAALFHSSDEITFQTKFFEAKESLNRFKQGIDKLDLDAESKQGMQDLVDYLGKKIDRRLTSSEDDSAIPTV